MQGSSSNLHSQSNLYNSHTAQYEKYDPRYGGGGPGNAAQPVPFTNGSAVSGSMGYSTQPNVMRGGSQSSSQMKHAGQLSQNMGYDQNASHMTGSSSFNNVRGGSQQPYQSYSKHQAQNLSKKPSKESLHGGRDQRGRGSDRYNQGSSKGGYNQGNYPSQKGNPQYAQMMPAGHDQR